MRGTSSIGRIAAVVGLVAAIGLVGWFLLGSTSYTVRAYFLNAGQLVNGNEVQVAGVKVGTVSSLEITDNGQAKVTFTVSDDYAPLSRGTKAAIRQASQSGIANRYVDVQLPEGNKASGKIPDGGVIGIDETTTQVELDELFNTLDPVARVAVQEFFKGQATQYRGKGKQANAGFRYLNPSLSTSSELFRELNRDTPTLVRFLEDSAQLTGALASRRDDLTDLITKFNVTTRALGNKRLELEEVLERFPGFMRTANTTFVNLRSTLDEVDPFVEASKPGAKKLPGFFRELRPFARNARPTLRDLSDIVRKRGEDNDLVELNRTLPPLARVACGTGGPVKGCNGKVKRNGESRRAAFPEISKAFEDGTESAAFFRPYAVDLVGWFDDFSHSGQTDAVTGFSRSQNYVNLFNSVDQDDLDNVFDEILGLNGQIDALETQLGVAPGGIPDLPDPVPPELQAIADDLESTREERAKLLEDVLTPLEDRLDEFKENSRQKQIKRCPGSAEEEAPDGSNVLSEEDQAALNCDESARATGNF